MKFDKFFSAFNGGLRFELPEPGRKSIILKSLMGTSMICIAVVVCLALVNVIRDGLLAKPSQTESDIATVCLMVANLTAFIGFCTMRIVRPAQKAPFRSQ